MRRKGTRLDPIAVLPPYHWANARSFEIARRLNERCLEWLARVASADATAPFDILRRNRDLWMRFGSRACTRAARTPVVLIDCNFRSVAWWTGVVHGSAHPIRTRDDQESWHPDDAARVLKDILTEARTIAFAEPRVAILIFGVPPDGVTLLASLTVAEIERIAVQYALELRPRWAEKAIFWRNLLLASVGESDERMSELYLHSLQLLGSEFLSSMTLNNGYSHNS
jgi:hypothetical protein